ncbi:putative HTH-type transcriptional regulator YazB [Paenibacillus sp. J31TS4]|uniref:helix-turn-helix domain-containing protein n=1 Tax=Paenibacillus sp. J31TS4 TaxID=2807195 RepID=UPI001B07611E|nr:helix-turn-helix transcriptional regulator [Paenibacillus sp. J31TS4]GIP41321.1 putative HTH-type transcriptional regulator YazB [Paenibacillus sp. J31TS4]
MEKFDLAPRIRAFRKLKGYTQTELAEKMGVSVSIIGAIERGTRHADAKTLNRIAEVLGLDPDEIGTPGSARKEWNS